MCREHVDMSVFACQSQALSRQYQQFTGTVFLKLFIFLLIIFSDLSSVSEQKKQGLSQLASMLELYLQREVHDLAQEMTSAPPPSCREPLTLIAKVILMHFYNTRAFIIHVQKRTMATMPQLQTCRPVHEKTNKSDCLIL